MRDYIIGTGYHEASYRDKEFAKMWLANTLRWGSPKGIVVVTTGAEFPWMVEGVQAIRGENLGHVQDLLDGRASNELCGWSISILLLALAAYNMRADFVFKEQDCLWHGPCDERMYEDCKDKLAVWGESGVMPTAQSLFLVKNEGILRFVSDYLSRGGDRRNDSLPEHKFAYMISNYPERYGWMSFGVDRDRPIPWGDDVFYAQQLTDEEISRWSAELGC